MITAAEKLLEFLAAFGIGVLLVLGAGLYLFYRLKREVEQRDPPREGQRPGTEARP